MKDWQYDQIISSLKYWVKQEGLCRFCDRGRMCPWSRRGRHECNGYLFTNERDCFHFWIAFFDKGYVFRDGYSHPDDYPWKDESPERDIPKFPKTFQLVEEKEYMEWKKRRLQQELENIKTGQTVSVLTSKIEEVSDRVKAIDKELFKSGIEP